MTTNHQRRQEPVAGNIDGLFGYGSNAIRLRDLRLSLFLLLSHQTGVRIPVALPDFVFFFFFDGPLRR